MKKLYTQADIPGPAKDIYPTDRRTDGQNKARD